MYTHFTYNKFNVSIELMCLPFRLSCILSTLPEVRYSQVTPLARSCDETRVLSTYHLTKTRLDNDYLPETYFHENFQKSVWTPVPCLSMNIWS